MTGSEPAAGGGTAPGLGRSPRRAAWLSEGLLLIECPPGASDREAGVPASMPRIAARAFRAPQGTIVAASPPPDWPAGPELLTFVDEGLGEELPIEVAAASTAITDLRTLLREGAAAWDADTRSALIDFLAGLGAQYGLSRSLSQGLRHARDALRERRPIGIDDRRLERGVVVDGLHRIDDGSFYVSGRAWDDAGPIEVLAASTPEGERVDLLESAFRTDTGDRFACLFHTAAPTLSQEGWMIEVASDPDHAVECAATLKPDALKTIFGDAALEVAGAETLRERHVMPAVSRIHERRRAAVAVAGVEEYGTPPHAPPLSIVAPLQRRVDLVEHQLAQFAADPAFETCELIYVLDDPQQRDLLHELAGELFRLYGLPFRVVSLTAVAGGALASNIGASLATADRLVLLDADVFPDRPGWLGTLAAALDDDPRAGAVGPKLLYEDEAIDQAGLVYASAESGREGEVEYRLRGFHRAVPAANRAEPVPALSAVCLMIDASTFREVGGLNGEYADPAYEGSDFCRRLEQRGLGSRYVPEAEMYRLEGLGAAPEPLGDRYARWLHARRWGSAIGEEGEAG